MGLLSGKTWEDPETGLIFHDSTYNWNNIPEPDVVQPTPPPQVQTQPKPLYEESVVPDNRGTFQDITPTLQPQAPAPVVQATAPEEIVATPTVTEEPIQEPSVKTIEQAYNEVNVGLTGINQFFHGVIDKEFSGGFMGFNPMNSMAHNAIAEHMRMYANPDKVSDEMIATTRRMIIDKAGSQLGQQKTAYILERFDQYVMQIKAYRNAKNVGASTEGLLPNVTPNSVLDMVR